ncbi:hypothetical protein HU200_035110 [Digitaria exilis]|uniref:C2H2-type domain-containing protein n=1 Tax=Digitaria exilis TaxID=1010633 RepID=A0A835BIL9_9POAL|nr:hypothetical protein HU200_035110 [Digitaria exilis]
MERRPAAANNLVKYVRSQKLQRPTRMFDSRMHAVACDLFNSLSLSQENNRTHAIVFVRALPSPHLASKIKNPKLLFERLPPLRDGAATPDRRAFRRQLPDSGIIWGKIFPTKSFRDYGNPRCGDLSISVSPSSSSSSPLPPPPPPPPPKHRGKKPPTLTTRMTTAEGKLQILIEEVKALQAGQLKLTSTVDSINNWSINAEKSSVELRKELTSLTSRMAALEALAPKTQIPTPLRDEEGQANGHRVQQQHQGADAKSPTFHHTLGKGDNHNPPRPKTLNYCSNVFLLSGTAPPHPTAVQALLDPTALSLALPPPALKKEDYLAICLAALAGTRKFGLWKKEQHHEAAQPQELPFRCAVCGKAFASYQALGGHKGGYRRRGAGCGGLRGDDDVLGRRWAAPVQHLPQGLRHGAGARRAQAVTLLGRLVGVGLHVIGDGVGDWVSSRMRRWVEEEEVQSPLPIKKRRTMLNC